MSICFAPTSAHDNLHLYAIGGALLAAAATVVFVGVFWLVLWGLVG